MKWYFVIGILLLCWVPCNAGIMQGTTDWYQSIDEWQEVSRTTTTIQCDVCGETITYPIITKRNMYANDCTPPIPNVTRPDYPNHWTVQPWFTGHDGCLQQVLHFVTARYNVYLKHMKRVKVK